MHKASKSLGVALMTVWLAACGGGSSSDADPEEGQTGGALAVQGMWDGETSADVDLGVLIEPSGTLWGFAVQEDFLRLLHGKVTADDNTAKGTLKEFDLFSGTVVTNSLESRFVPKKSISGSMTGAGKISFKLDYVADYEKKATLPEIEGVWKLGSSVLSMQATVAADGRFQGKTTLAGTSCDYSGKFTPDTEHHYYHGELVFGRSAGCQYAGKTMTGVAVRGEDDGGADGDDAYLVAGFVDAAETAGLVFGGVRQR